MKSNFLLTKLMLLLCLLVGSVNGAWADVTDELDLNLTGVSGTSYTSWSGKEATSDAVYAGQSAGGNNSIQLRSSNSNSGVVTTTSGGKVKSITVEWNSKTTNGRTLNVYGKNAAYTDPTDLYNSSTQGDLLGTIVKGTSTSLTVKGDYEYIGFCSASGAMYLTTVTIVWASGDVSKVSTPYVSGNLSFLTSTEVSITCSTDGATIQYSTDNGTSWNNYSAPFTLTETTTVTAKATKNGLTDSDESSETFTKIVPLTVSEAIAVIDDKDADKTNRYVEGIVCTGGSSLSSGAMNYWISDDGTETSRLEIYKGKGVSGKNFTSTNDIQVGDKVVVYGDLTLFNNTTYEFSAGSQLFSHITKVAKPNFTPEAGAVAAGTNVVIETVTEGATIYYTTDGTEPTTSSSVYSSPITVNVAMTIKALAVKDGYPNSDVAIAAYTIAEPAATPTFSVAAGAYTSIQDVELTTATDGATIYYTTDGSEPTTESKEYTAAIKVKESLTIKAIAAKDGMANSEVATAAYTIILPDYATLPFEFDGGKAAIDDVCGLTQVGLDSDYGSSPYLKFNGTGDYMILKIDETPGTLTFDIKGNSFSGGTFTVETSADGEKYTALKAYTDLGDTQSETFNNLAATVRYIKWIYTEKSKGNVALGNIKLNNKVDVKLASSGYASFCSPLPLDLTPTEDYAAWAVTATNNTEVTFTKIQGAVPAETPFILYGEDMGDQTITLPVATGVTTAVADNMLVGTLEETSVTTLNGEYTNFGLSNGEFVKLNNGTIPANKAYLPILTAKVPTAAARLTIVFDEGMATGIANTNRESTDNRYFNLNGQQVKTPQKGMYIVNGKKVIIK